MEIFYVSRQYNLVIVGAVIESAWSLRLFCCKTRVDTDLIPMNFDSIDLLDLPGLPDPIPHRKPISLRKHAELMRGRVESLGTTTMSELIDYLVDLRQQEEQVPLTKAQHQGIQRRVYDIINVLLAVGVIILDKRTIRWLGFPNAAEAAAEEERRRCEKRRTSKNPGLI